MFFYRFHNNRGVVNMNYNEIPLQTAIVIGLAETIKRLGLLNKRYIPLVDIFLGVVLGVSVNLAEHKGIMDGILQGIIVGLSACGLYSGSKNIIEEE